MLLQCRKRRYASCSLTHSQTKMGIHEKCLEKPQIDTPMQPNTRWQTFTLANSLLTTSTPPLNLFHPSTTAGIIEEAGGRGFPDSRTMNDSFGHSKYVCR